MVSSRTTVPRVSACLMFLDIGLVPLPVAISSRATHAVATMLSTQGRT